MKVLSVVGARPNFVKLAAVEPYFSKLFDHVVVHTGQHYDYELSRVFLEHFDIPEPHYFLGVGSGLHGYQVGEMVKRVEKVLLGEKPDLVVVYGDTNSTLAGALAAVKAGFRVAHVEAGLRSYNMMMPEEINRRVVDHVSWLLFAPTKTAVENLKREGMLGYIYLTGDVHMDVLQRWIEVAEAKSRIIKKLGLKSKGYIVATIHRAENTDNAENLKKIVAALLNIPYKVVFPIHPRTRNALTNLGLLNQLEKAKNIVLTKPLGYLDFIKLLKHAWKVITDSGGVQREAYLLGVPCIVLRNETEWKELVEIGWAKLVGTDSDKIVGAVKSFEPSGERPPLLGDGRVAEMIANIIQEKLTIT